MTIFEVCIAPSHGCAVQELCFSAQDTLLAFARTGFSSLVRPDNSRKRAGVFLHRAGNGAAVNELPLAAAFDELRVSQHFEVVRNGGGRDPSQRDQLTAIYPPLFGDGLKDHEARLIR